MNNYLICLKAMFKNKLRLSGDRSKKSLIAFIALLVVTYALVMTALLSTVVSLKVLLSIPEFTILVYFFILITSALIVLVFGIVHLVSTLYLSKDTDFYSMLPIKSSTVFAAKLSFVYLFETGLVAVVTLPLFIALGIVANARAGFYIITLLTVFAVPAMPLLIAAIFSVPTMFIASKLKNRNIVALIFYLVLFGGFFGVYIYFLSADPGSEITEESMRRMAETIKNVLYVFYPYTALSYAACGIPSFGLSAGASTAANLAIFYGISLAFVVIIMLAAKFMYAQSVKANNQTNNSVAKKGEYKSSTGIRSLIKREYISSLRTTQTAFQCYAVMLLPIIFSVMFGVTFKNTLTSVIAKTEGIIDSRFFLLISYSMFAALYAALGNGSLTTFSREGKAMASLKILPVKPTTLLRAKVTAWLIFALPVSAIGVVIFSVFMFDLASFLLAIFALVPLTAVFLLFAALWDLSAPKLNWTDPMQAIKHNGHGTIGQLIQLAPGLVIMILCLVIFSVGISFDTIYALFWGFIYLELVIFIVVDILLYRKVDKFYNRIEI